MDINTHSSNLINSVSNNNNSADTSFMYSLNNIIQESNSYYRSSLIEAFQNLQEEVSQEEFINDDVSLYENNNLSSLSSRNSNESSNNNNNPQETSTVNSNDICLDTSFYNGINLDALNGESKIDKKDSSKSPKDDTIKQIAEHKRVSSAPLRLLNDFEEFKYSS